MKRKHWIPVALVVALAGPAPGYDSLQALDRDFQRQKSEALKTYLDEHAAAADAEEAGMMLVRLYMDQDQTAEAVAILEGLYAKAAEEQPPDMPKLIGMIVMPLAENYLRSGEKDKVRDLVKKTRERLPEDANGAAAEQALRSIETELAQPAVGDTMDLEFTGVGGEQVSLAGLTKAGKVVLVDFWATWCGPCVRELPTVLQAYRAYHDKGLEIIGISLDKDRAALKTFLAQRNVPWPQYFDGKGWESDLGIRFGITSIPATFLVGKDGKVAYRDLRGPALEEALAKLLD